MADLKVCHRCKRPVGSYWIGDTVSFGGTYIMRPEGPEHLNGCMVWDEKQGPDGVMVRTSRMLPLVGAGLDGDTPICF